jgi:hypothetical protein
MLNSYGFIFIANGADPTVDRLVLDRQGFRNVIVAAPDQSAAEEVAIELVDDGIQFIELCGIFGPVGTAKVIEATGEKVPIGSVNFGAESIDALAALRDPAM